MSKKLQAIILALGLSVVIFGVGCSSDDDDENPPAGPTAQERLVGFWDATNPDDIVGIGGGYVEFDFFDDSTFSLVIAAVTGPLDDTLAIVYTGTYHASGDGNMHLTDIEMDNDPIQDDWTWAYSQFADDDSMTVTHTDIVETSVVGRYINVTPPTN